MDRDLCPVHQSQRVRPVRPVTHCIEKLTSIVVRPLLFAAVIANTDYLAVAAEATASAAVVIAVIFGRRFDFGSPPMIPTPQSGK